MKKYNIAVVGALGNVGTEMLDILEKSELPIRDLLVMDTLQNVGRKILWRGVNHIAVSYTHLTLPTILLV